VSAGSDQTGLLGVSRCWLAPRPASLVGALRGRVASRPDGGITPAAVLERTKPAQGTRTRHEVFAAPSNGDAQIYKYERNMIGCLGDHKAICKVITNRKRVTQQELSRSASWRLKITGMIKVYTPARSIKPANLAPIDECHGYMRK